MTIAALLLFSACKKQVQTEQPIENTPPVKNEISLEKDVEDLPDETVESAPIATLSANFNRIHFDVDSYVLNTASKDALSENIKILDADKSIRLEIQGHADERGTTDYNLSLGHQRAQSVYDYILSHGVTPDRLKVISYGEERPLENVSGETAWSQNRRCEFVILWSDNPAIKGSL